MTPSDPPRREPPGSARPPRLVAFVARLASVREEEAVAAVWAFLYHFCILACYFVLRPIREAFGIAGGAERLPDLFLGTFLLMCLAYPLYTAVATRFPRRRLIPFVYRFFALNLVAFFAWLHVRAGKGSLAAEYAFFVWLSVFNLFAVTVFWGFLADVFSQSQSKRVFAFAAGGGSLGAIAGAKITGLLVGTLGSANMLLVAVVFLELAVQCVRRLVKLFGVGETTPTQRDGEAEAVTGVVEEVAARTRKAASDIGGGVLSGVKLFARSPYLMGIGFYIFAMSISQTFVYFFQGYVVEGAFADRASRAHFFAQVDFWTQTATLTLQLLLAGRVIRTIGVACALAVLPMVSLGATVWLATAPALLPLVVFRVLQKSMNYSISRPAREMLFTVLGRIEKYKSKSFIDTFVYRTSDAAGALAQKALTALGLGISASLLAVTPLLAAWSVVAFLLGRRQAVLAREIEPGGEPRAGSHAEPAEPAEPDAA